MGHAKHSARIVLRSHRGWWFCVISPRVYPQRHDLVCPFRDRRVVVAQLLRQTTTTTTTTTTTMLEEQTNHRSLIGQHIRSRQATKSEWLQEQLVQWKETSKPFSKGEILDILDAWVEQWKTRKSSLKISPTQSSPEPISPAEMVTILKATSPTTSFPLSEDPFCFMSMYSRLIDGIVEAAKAKRRLEGLVTIAEVSCLDPMIRLYLQSSVCGGIVNNNNEQDAATTMLVHSCNKVMTMHCRDKKVSAAEQLLYRLEETIDEKLRLILDGDEEIRRRRHHQYSIPVNTYGIVISGYAKLGMPREAEHILFARMIQKRKLVPSKDLFEVCLSAWESARTKDSGQRAEFLILRHQQYHEARPKQIDPPNAKTLARAVNTWVNSRHPEAPARIEKLLETMYAAKFHDDLILANAHVQAMKLWASKAEPQKCKACMEMMVSEIGKERIPPLQLQRMYAARITAYARSLVAYKQELRDLMAELEKEGRAGSFGNQKYWDQAIYVAMFDAHARYGYGADAELLLARLIRDSNEDETAPKPNLNSYNAVLLAWSRSKDLDAAQKAERVFLQMQTERRDNRPNAILPDVVSYNAVLAAMSRATVKTEALALRGESYLQDLEDKENFRATTVTFNQALLLWCRVHSPNVIERIDKLLERMSSAGIPPDGNTLQSCRLVVESMDTVDAVERNRLLAKYSERFAMVRNDRAPNRQK
jgi:pentatricopeptide repeat protein